MSLKAFSEYSDLITLLRGAEHFIGPPGSTVTRTIIHRRKSPREQRSLVVLCQGPCGSCVVKPTASEDELDVAHMASELGIGPEIYHMTESVIIEEYLPGKPLYKWWNHCFTSEYFGNSLGKLLAELHSEKLFFVDVFFPHLYLRENGAWCLLDYGCATSFSAFEDVNVKIVSFLAKRYNKKLSDLTNNALYDLLQKHDYNSLKKEINTHVFPIPLHFSIFYRRKAVEAFTNSYGCIPKV